MKQPKEVEKFDGVLVVGAGLVGALTGLCLARKGFRVRLVEFRDDFRAELDADSPLKRSINLALSTRGKAALRYAGLLEEVEKLLTPMYGRAIHKQPVEGKEMESLIADQIQPYDEIDSTNFINSVSRRDLNILLLNELESHAGVKVEFNSKVVKVDRSLCCEIARTEKEGDKKKESFFVQPALLIGCDGAFSVVRQHILKYNFSNFSQTYIPHGYKELEIKPKDGKFGLPQINYLHIWPRGDFMMIGLPNQDKTFTCTLFAPFEALTLKTDESIVSYFQTNFPSFLDTIPDLVAQYKRNPSSKLVSIIVDDWTYFPEDSESAALLLGDAAHACVPFYGQGFNCGFEDVLELCLKLDSLAGKENLYTLDLLIQSVKEFSQVRVKDAQACGVLSYNNYEEMRHHTRSQLFLLKKKVEGCLNKFLGEKFIPLYKMVTFTRIPYSEVIEKDARQQNIMKKVSIALALITSAGVVAAVGLKFSKRD